MKVKFLQILGIILCLYVGSASAQTAERPIAVELGGGLSQYSGSLGSNFYKFNEGNYLFGYGSGSFYLNKWVDLVLSLNYATIGFKADGTKVNKNGSFHGTYDAENIHARIKLFGDRKFYPYALAGIGMINFRKGDMAGSNVVPTSSLALPVGLGVFYQATERIGIRAQNMLTFTTKGGWDTNDNGYGDDVMTLSLGVSYNFGKGGKPAPKDADGDGVADELDKCAGTVAGTAVDANGCPVDTDKDGVTDALDKCPGTPAGVTVDVEGCPVDTDQDGVADYLDKCPGTTVDIKVDANGCPIDTDKDGIPDHIDECDNHHGTHNLNGCPDTDEDGIVDHLDKCPTVKGVAAHHGCPDTDGDGVIDSEDKCPNTAGPAENHGCPVVKAEVKRALDKALAGIKFQSGTDKLTKSSFPSIDAVVKVLKENPEYELDIEGHTDNVGAPEKNMELSKLRAEAVRKYILSKGIADKRLEAKGFGETMPVESNDTPAGKAKNRRVEFKVIFK